MRKEVTSDPAATAPAKSPAWLDLNDIAVVQVSSEDKEYPVEGALLGEAKPWKAATPGGQTIRLIFDTPQSISRISLVMEDVEMWRTQEFVLRWSADKGATFKEIVRQQWNFSPPNAIRETEDYTVQLRGVTVLELAIVPDIQGGDSRATVSQWRVA